MHLRLVLVFLVFCGCQKQEAQNTIKVELRPQDLAALNHWVKSNPGPTHHGPHPSFPLRAILKDQPLSGEIRLRGDLAAHWLGPVKSWRLHLKQGHIDAQSELDLIIPDDKYYELELIAYRWAKQLGIPAPEARFIDMQINNEIPHTYFMSEVWNQAAFTRRGWQKATIISENNAWLTTVTKDRPSLYQNVFMRKGGLNPLAFEINIYRATDHSTFSQLAMTRFADMLNEMKSPLAQNIVWEKYIDIELATNWVALVLLFGSEHAVLGDNVRWLTTDELHGKFIPLIYDVLAFPRFTLPGGCHYDRFARINPWISLWMKRPELKEKILLKLKVLLDDPEFNFQKSWQEIEGKYPIAWDEQALKWRKENRETILKNIEQLHQTAANNFCTTKN